MFLDGRDRQVYLQWLERTIRRYRWLCLSYCLMDNHVHLLVETQEPNLGLGMQWFHGQYGRYFADKIDRPGHVFQKPFGSKRVKDESQLWTVIRYIAQNPVEAGLCDAPLAWAWSSHAAVIGGEGPKWLARGRLLEYFEGLGGEPVERYAALVGQSTKRRSIAQRLSS